MADNFDTCLTFTLQQEGGFVNNPKDPGGATNFGITLGVLRTFQHNPGLGVDDIRNIAQATVKAIYMADYWNRMRCDALPAGVDLMVFDHGVNAGPARGGRSLQASLGFAPADQDGAIGPNTIRAATGADPTAAVNAMADNHEAYYRSLASFADFGNGWLARLARRKAAVLAMLG
jgi:lysozyme family protein